MSPSTRTDPRLARQPQRPAQQPQRPPIVIRPFAAPIVRELPPRRVVASAAW